MLKNNLRLYIWIQVNFKHSLSDACLLECSPYVASWGISLRATQRVEGGHDVVGGLEELEDTVLELLLLVS